MPRRRGVRTSLYGRENGLWWFGAGTLPYWPLHLEGLIPHYRYVGMHRK